MYPEFRKLEFSMVLEFHQKFSGKFEGYFFKEFKFRSARVLQT